MEAPTLFMIVIIFLSERKILFNFAEIIAIIGNKVIATPAKINPNIIMYNPMFWVFFGTN